MAISEGEREQMRQWVENWRYAGPILEEMKTRELRAMTEEELRLAAERVMEAVPVDPERSTTTSGLVEQQRWFMKARGC